MTQPEPAPAADPVTLEEWQQAVNAASACLALDAARQYGLVTGGPGVNVDRCGDILRRGALLGVTPAGDAIEEFMAELAAIPDQATPAEVSTGTHRGGPRRTGRVAG